MLQNGEYPERWIKGIITPIFNKGKHIGITLINELSKVYSQILLNRLVKWINLHDTLCDNQYRFQKGKSIIDCIFIFHALYSKVLSTGNTL